jgi:DNA-binding XRE family transcriptional regulator
MELRQLRGLQGVTYPERSMRLLAGWGRAAFDSRWPVCEKRTMTGSASTSAADLGRRIAQARQEADLTQAELGHAVGLDRTAIAKVETGVRKVSAAELLAIASVLDRPIDSFVFEPRHQWLAAGPTR